MWIKTAYGWKLLHISNVIPPGQHLNQPGMDIRPYNWETRSIRVWSEINQSRLQRGELPIDRMEHYRSLGLE